MVCVEKMLHGNQHNVLMQSVCDDVIFTMEEIDVTKHSIVLAARKEQRSHFLHVSPIWL